MNSVLPPIITDGRFGLKIIACNLSGAGFGAGGSVSAFVGLVFVTAPVSFPGTAEFVVARALGAATTFAASATSEGGLGLSIFVKVGAGGDAGDGAVLVLAATLV